MFCYIDEHLSVVELVCGWSVGGSVENSAHTVFINARRLLCVSGGSPEKCRPLCCVRKGSRLLPKAEQLYGSHPECTPAGWSHFQTQSPTCPTKDQYINENHQLESESTRNCLKMNTLISKGALN